MFRLISVLVSCLFIATCTITQTIEPSSLSRDAELCVVENPAVREGFLQELKAVLDSEKIPYSVGNAEQVMKRCEWSMTYTANWRWDMALYMSYANIKVYHHGVLDGEAVYDSSGGGANMAKFIDAETKIRELLGQLLKQ